MAKKRREAETTTYAWGGGKPLAPSIRRVEPWGWAWASALGGVAAGALALALDWRPLPGLPLPLGGAAEHAAHWARIAAHAMMPRVVAGDGAYQAFVGGLPLSERVGMALRVALAACAAAAPAVLLAKPMLRPRDGLIFLRGSSRYGGAEAKGRLASRLAERVARSPDHEIAPGVAYPSDMWTRHVLVVGGVGSGKSTAIKPLIDKIVASGEQMLLFDPKSEFTIGFGGPALVAPWDRRSLAWDVARDMRNALDMRRFAAAMIKESSDPMWSNASRQLLVGLLIHLKSTRGDGWGWGDLKALVALPQSELLPIMRECHPEAVRAVEKASVTTAGILINLSAFCSSIFDLAEAWGAVPSDRRISFVEWTRGESRFPQIILQGHGAYAELTRGYAEGIVGIVSAMVNSVEMEDDPGRKIWFIADEFAQMGKIPVRALFEVGRSRGVRCVVACQDLSQLEELYGAPMVKALVAMCGTLLVGQTMAGETADQLCRTFGSREVERENVSSAGWAGAGRSNTTSFSREDVPLYKPSELASRLGLTRDGKGVVLILFTGGEAYELFWPHYKLRRERAAQEPAPWTLGIGLGKRGALALADASQEPGAALENRDQFDGRGADARGPFAADDDGLMSAEAEALVDAGPWQDSGLGSSGDGAGLEGWEGSGLEDSAWRDALLPEDGLSSFDGLISRLGLAPDGADMADGAQAAREGALTSDGELASGGGANAGRAHGHLVDGPLAPECDAKDPLADAIAERVLEDAEHVVEDSGHGVASAAVLLAHGVDALFDSGPEVKDGARKPRSAPSSSRPRAKGLESSSGVDRRGLAKAPGASAKRSARPAAGNGGKGRSRERGLLE